MDSPITDVESTSEHPQSFDEPDGPSAYLVAIEDLFRVEDADSPEEAERIVLERLGEEPFEAYDAQVVDTEP
jgi:hypothetical protein